MVMALTFQRHWGSMHMEGSWLRRESMIFITQWHTTCRHHTVWWRKSVLLPLLSLWIFFFHLSVYSLLSGHLRVSMCSSPAVTVPVCTDGRQEGQTVYCFRPCSMPAVMDGLGWAFSSDLSVSQLLWAQSVRSLAATSNHTLISLEQKKKKDSTVEDFSQRQNKDSSKPRCRPPKLCFQCVKSEEWVIRLEGKVFKRLYVPWTFCQTFHNYYLTYVK